MSTRFVLARPEPRAELAQAGWRRLRLGAYDLFSGPDTPISAFRDELVIIGRAFANGTPIGACCPSSLALAIIGSDGRFAAEKLWGRFALFWCDRRRLGVQLYRDPSAQLPVFLARAGSVLAFTDLDDLSASQLESFTIDMTAVAHRLFYDQLPTRTTSLAEVEELLPGAAIFLGDKADPPRQLWSPWTFAGTRARTSPAPDPVHLRGVLTEAVATLATPDAPILLELSGGLDSSILAACLADAGTPATALTLVTPGPDGDERRYAAPVAQALGLELDVRVIGEDEMDLQRGPCRPTPNPNPYGMLRALDHCVAAAARATGARALMSGTGGDNVFCSLRSVSPLLDAWRCQGPSRARGAARNLAGLVQSSYWRLALAMVRYSWLDWRAPDRWRADLRLLARDCRPALQHHPWLHVAPTRLAGARGHVVMLLRAHNVLGAHDRFRSETMLFPLLAQPVLEYCLSLPTWSWFEGGRDRSIARQAFRNSLPATTIDRRSKGRRDYILIAAYEQQRAGIAERLLDGRLAAAGILDRRAVEAAAAAPPGNDDMVMRLLELNEAELWLARMSQRP